MKCSIHPVPPYPSAGGVHFSFQVPLFPFSQCLLGGFHFSSPALLHRSLEAQLEVAEKMPPKAAAPVCSMWICIFERGLTLLSVAQCADTIVNPATHLWRIHPSARECRHQLRDPVRAANEQHIVSQRPSHLHASSMSTAPCRL